MWSSGDEILVRRLHRGRVWFANSGVVVADGEAELVVWLAPDTVVRSPEGELFGDWALVETVRDEPVLRIMPAGRAHATLLFWNADWTFRGWYVNLETNRRTPLGVDVEDHILDVWIAADGTVEWLDEDELAEGLERGVISPETAASARAEGERVLEEWPFPTGREDWRPPPEWRAPVLPPGWDAV